VGGHSKAISLGFAAEGASVVVAATTLYEIEETGEDIRGKGRRGKRGKKFSAQQGGNIIRVESQPFKKVVSPGSTDCCRV